MEISKEEFLQLSNDWSALVDHRAALINMRVFDVTSYDDAHVLTVYDAQDVCNLSEPFDYNPDDLIAVYRFDSASDAHAAFIAAIIERLSGFPV